MASPLVSVCIPVFNGERFIEAAVRSVLAQTYGDFELLVFDNASTDDTIGRMGLFSDARIRVYRHERNLGPQANWNSAMAAARGKYLKILCHDDLIAPECLERQVRSLEANPSSVLAFCGRTVIRPDGRRLLTRRPPWKDGTVTASAAFRRCVLAGGNVIGEPGAVLFRADVAARAGGFDASNPYLIDLDYWLRLMAFGTAWCDQAIMASFRISSHQWSVDIGRRQGRAFIDFTERVQTSDAHRLDSVTRLLGRARARLNGALRRLIYQFMAGGG